MKTSLYLPDDLAQQIKEYGISISEIAQSALRAEVQRVRTIRMASKDIEALARRLFGEYSAEQERAYLDACDTGMRWAQRHASLDELCHVAGLHEGDFEETFETEHSIVQFLAIEDDYDLAPITLTSAKRTDRGFVAGARAVQETLQSWTQNGFDWRANYPPTTS